MKSLGNAVQNLRRGQQDWSARSVAERLKFVRRLRGLVSDASDRIARAISEEGGKSPLEALTQEVLPTLDTCLFLERRAEGILADRPLEFQSRLFFASKKENVLVHAPVGVVGILGTWNYAFFLNLTQALFALTAGNTVFLKFSELSPKVAELAAGLLAEAGFGAELIHVSAGGVDEGRALTGAGCDKYILTGSRAAGRAVLGRLAEDLKPAVVELSGSDAYVIFSDADWKLAVKSLVWAAFQYSGQTCVAPRRVIVLQRDRDKFLKRFKEAAAGCAEFVRTQGTLRTEKFAADERRKIEEIRTGGAELLWKSDRAEGPAVVEPQLWGGVSPETAGNIDWMSPVLLLITVQDEAAVIQAAQKTPFGLAASVWTRSRVRAERAARAIRAGQVWVNDTLFTVALGEAPFGGVGQSGFGKTRGSEGLLEMTESRLVSSDFRSGRIQLHLPPYRSNSYAIIQQIQKIWFGTRPLDKLRGAAGLMQACVKNDSPQKK